MKRSHAFPSRSARLPPMSGSPRTPLIGRRQAWSAKWRADRGRQRRGRSADPRPGDRRSTPSGPGDAEGLAMRAHARRPDPGYDRSRRYARRRSAAGGWVRGSGAWGRKRDRSPSRMCASPYQAPLAVQDSELHVLEEAFRRPGVPLSVHNVVPLVLAGEPAERLTARALGEGTNFGMLVAEILEAEARHR
jgi:hypothetical protein